MSSTTLVQQYFAESARLHPHKVAVGCRTESLTYEQLDQLTNAHARQLRELGLTRGSFVPFFMKKSVGSIVSLLSILKADCAYVPLDVNSPRQRLLDILAATGCSFVITDKDSAAALRAAVGADSPVQIYEISAPPSASVAALTPENLSIDIAYALFTSGSTGTPKGVMISHQMIVDYIEWCVDTYGIVADDVLANHAPFYFDNSTFDIYTTWKAGATLHVIPDEMNLVLSRLVSWLEERSVTIMFCVPSVMTILWKSGRLKPESLPCMRHVIAAGEVLPTEVVRNWMQLLPKIQYTNMYGPTEITVDCTYHVITSLPEPTDAIPIGRPRRNMEVLLMLEDGTLTDSAGAEGEIVVRGTSVAYGYLNDPARTAAAFIQNPRHDRFHDPLYRTGDLGRMGDQGQIYFLGRRDHQIKYMGNRIELGEIEASILRIPGVLEVTVVFNDSPSIEDKCIGALLCLDAKTTQESVVAAMRRELPAYMLPRKVAVVGDMPRTPNGKSDRKQAFDILFPR